MALFSFGAICNVHTFWNMRARHNLEQSTVPFSISSSHQWYLNRCDTDEPNHIHHSDKATFVFAHLFAVSSSFFLSLSRLSHIFVTRIIHFSSITCMLQYNLDNSKMWVTLQMFFCALALLLFSFTPCYFRHGGKLFNEQHTEKATSK